MNGLMGTLKGKVMGVPVWLLVAALAGLGYWYVKNRNTSSAQDDSDSGTAGVFDMAPLAEPMPTQSIFYINVPGAGDGGTTTSPPAGGAPGGSTQPPGSTIPGGHPGSPTPPGKVKSITYTVQKGDTLSAIANKYHVKGGWKSLYQADKSLIDSTARAHGYKGDKPYNYIYPGEKLVIPA